MYKYILIFVTYMYIYIYICMYIYIYMCVCVCVLLPWYSLDYGWIFVNNPKCWCFSILNPVTLEKPPGSCFVLVQNTHLEVAWSRWSQTLRWWSLTHGIGEWCSLEHGQWCTWFYDMIWLLSIYSPNSQVYWHTVEIFKSYRHKEPLLQWSDGALSG